jgi:hypothetical protein
MRATPNGKPLTRGQMIGFGLGFVVLLSLLLSIVSVATVAQLHRNQKKADCTSSYDDSNIAAQTSGYVSKSDYTSDWC